MGPLRSEKPCAVPNNSRLGGGYPGRLSEEGSGGILHSPTGSAWRAKGDKVGGCRSGSAAGEQPAGLGDVLADFRTERFHAGKPALVAQAMMELHPQRRTVQILIAVQ